MQTVQTSTKSDTEGLRSTSRSGLRISHSRQRSLWGFLFALPAIAFIAVFAVYPIARTFYLGFFDYSVIKTPTFVGLKNFRTIIGDQRFNESLLNSLGYVVMTYVPVWILALMLAMALNAKIRGRGLFRTVYFVPVVMSWVVVSVIWKLIFHRQGLFNTLFLGPFGLDPRNWLTDVDLAPQAIVIMSIWKEVGFFMVVFLAGLQNIPSDYYEAARVDGSTGPQLFRYITLPLLQPTMLFCTVIGLITGLQVFIPQFVMTGGGPIDATLVLTLNIYETGFVFLDGGKAAALSVVLCLIIGAVTFVQFRLYRGRT
jgi:multiple sugar transport system permease protein